ncbi:MAG: 6-carboxytetrahydropterin synthase QueD [bacterium]|nr:MAG: 6-carboxytetrahydropterin synthase QueD [bacterium]
MFKISVTTKFAAAHKLRGYEGPCENLHGHNWQIKATIGIDELDDIGIAYDFKKLKKYLNEIIERFDHQFLNDVAPFDQLNPTSENLAKYIFHSLTEKLPSHIKVVSIEVGESDQYKAIYEE